MNKIESPHAGIVDAMKRLKISDDSTLEEFVEALENRDTTKYMSDSWQVVMEGSHEASALKRVAIILGKMEYLDAYQDWVNGGRFVKPSPSNWIAPDTREYITSILTEDDIAILKKAVSGYEWEWYQLISDLRSDLWDRAKSNLTAIH